MVRRYTFAVAVLLSLVVSPVEAQQCAPGVVPGFQNSNRTAAGFQVSWSHPPGYGPGTTYEVVNDYAPTECQWLAGQQRNQQVVAQVTGTSYTVQFSPAEATLCYYVRVASCPQIASLCTPVWNYSSPPLRPNLISVAASGPAQATVTFSHPDDRTPVFLQRAGADGVFRIIDFPAHCPAGSIKSVTDYGQPDSQVGVLPPGTYQYRLVALTEAAQNVSEVKTVVVGGSSCVPPQVAPQVSASATNVIVDAAVTINWTTSENPDRFLIEISNDPNFTSGVRAFNVPGRERTATIRFPDPGVFSLRVTAVNACGKKEGTRVQFNVSPPPPRVVVAAKPSGMLQVIGEPAASDSYTLTNFGGTSTTITLTQSGGFFTQSPTQFTLAPGGSQVITIVAQSQSAPASLAGESRPSGAGLPTALVIPVRLFASTRPSGDPDAKASANRVDVAAVEGGVPIGSIQFTNRGTGSVKGLLVSNVPWIVPLDEFVNIPPGQAATFNFRIDRLQRARARGSETGTLQLFYMRGPSGKSSKGSLSSTPPPGSKATLVTISDTVKPAVTSTGIPPITADELAFFVPGVGHVQGSVGLFISDVSILNTGSIEDLNDLKVYLMPAAGTPQLASFAQLSANQSLNLADVSKSVFNNEGQVSSLQVRTTKVSTIGINASIFNSSNPAGTYGTSLPIFRSDRSVGVNEKLYLTGLRKDATGYTNVYVQEMAGQVASFNIDYLSAAGNNLGSSSGTVQPFSLLFIGNPLPQNAVAVVVTNTSTNGARILAHATPVDQLTGDTWSIADWARQYGYATTEAAIIPVAGKLKGANNSDFRTDVSIMNTGTSTSSGTLRYYPSGGTAIDRLLTLGPQESRILPDVIGSLFGISTTSVGYLLFTPASGNFVVTSRTYTLAGDQQSTFGTGVPTLSFGAALKPGEVRKISGFEDATSSTVTAATPATFRTNLGLAETLGQAVTVRATMRYTAVQGAASAVGISSTDIALQPRQLLLAPSVTTLILGANRSLFGELRDIQVDFEIVSGTGNVVVFTTSTDNGTNDTALRVE